MLFADPFLNPWGDAVGVPTQEDLLWQSVDAGLSLASAPTGTRIKEFVPFGEWMKEARTDFSWDYRHFIVMQEKLDAVTRGKLFRVYFQVPIRHGKTEHNTISYAAYRLEQDPTCKIIVCSYNDRRAQKFSRDIRRLVVRRGKVPLSRERTGAGEWETEAGGGVQAFGAKAGVAGVNADVIIIDDPIGSRDDAESQATRDQVWDWLTNDILARCEPHTAVLMTMSRWHMDDPAGRLLDRMRAEWDVVDLPAEAEPNDPLGRAIGEPLWPEMRGREWLRQKRAEIGDYGFASLLQGRPRPREGGMFKWESWVLTSDIPLTFEAIVRFWDTAGTEAKGNSGDPDYTVGAMLLRKINQKTVVVDIARFRHNVAQRDAQIAIVAKQDAQKYPGRIRWRFEQEAGVGGKDRTAHLMRIAQNALIPCDSVPATGDKTTRAEPFASAVGQGNVELGPGDWRDALREEAADFPAGKHDDQIDACSGAYNMLAVPVGSWGTATYTT